MHPQRMDPIAFNIRILRGRATYRDYLLDTQAQMLTSAADKDKLRAAHREHIQNKEGEYITVKTIKDLLKQTKPHPDNTNK